MSDVNKQLLDALKESIRLSAELMISAVGIEPTEAGIDRVIGISKEGSAIYRFMQVIAAAEQAQQAEPVAWEYREFHDDNIVTPGWGKWKRIESEEWAGRKVLSVVADIREFIAQGYRYELRALYAQPPAMAGAVPDEREAFEAWLQKNIDDTDTVRPSKEKVDAYFAVWLARAMLADPAKL